MSNAREYHVDGFQLTAGTFLAHVVDNDGADITQAGVSSISCQVYEQDSGDYQTAPTVTVNTSISDTMQTDAKWTLDTEGYNFAHQVAGSAFPSAITYRVQYILTMVSGEPVVFVFIYHAKPLYTHETTTTTTEVPTTTTTGA